MKKHHWLAVVLLTGAQWGCQQATEKSEGALAGEDKSLIMAPLPEAPRSPPAEVIIQDPTSLAVAVPATLAARLLVYHAKVRLKATSIPHATARLDSLVRRSGGYISTAAETRADGEWRQTATIRVLPAQFHTLLSGLAGLGIIEEKKLSTNDVTAEHADVTARLQTKRAVAQQYTTLLVKAQKIKAILDIEEKLGEVREEIEATESRLKTLNNEVAYSTIELTLYQPLPQSIPDAPIVSLGSRVVGAFYGGWQLLLSLLVGTISLWPVFLLGMGGWGLWRRRSRRANMPAQLASNAVS